MSDTSLREAISSIVRAEMATRKRKKAEDERLKRKRLRHDVLVDRMVKVLDMFDDFEHPEDVLFVLGNAIREVVRVTSSSMEDEARTLGQLYYGFHYGDGWESPADADEKIERIKAKRARKAQKARKGSNVVPFKGAHDV